MKRSICLFVILSLFAILPHSPSIAFQKITNFSATSAKKDLEYLSRLLKKVHPNLYAHRSPKQINRRFKQLIASADDAISSTDFLILVQKMLAVACDEHTRITLNNLYKNMDPKVPKMFPLNLVVTKETVQLENRFGTRSARILTKINHHPSENVRDLVRQIVSTDGCLEDGIISTRLQNFDTKMLLSNFLGTGRYYKIYDPVEEKLNAASLSVLFGSRYFSKTKPTRSIGLKKLNMPLSFGRFSNIHDRNSPVIFEVHSPDWQYAYVHVSHFLGGKKSEQEIDKVMRRIIKNKPKHLILDLTENPGGAINLSSRLLSYLLHKRHFVANRVYRKSKRAVLDKSYIQLSKEKLQVQKRNARLFRKARRRHGRYTLRVRPTSFGHPSYRGKLTVLVSPMTHSAATMAAVILKRQRGATIVGYQNGGSTKTSCFAPNGVYALPKTKIQVLIPDTCFTRAGNSKRKNKRLPVDIAVDPVARPANELLEATLTAGVEHVLASK